MLILPGLLSLGLETDSPAWPRARRMMLAPPSTAFLKSEWIQIEKLAAPKIKKKSKSTSAKTSAMPRQGAIPCLVLVVIALGVVAFFFFASFHVS